MSCVDTSCAILFIFCHQTVGFLLRGGGGGHQRIGDGVRRAHDFHNVNRSHCSHKLKPQKKLVNESTWLLKVSLLFYIFLWSVCLFKVFLMWMLQSKGARSYNLHFTLLLKSPLPSLYSQSWTQVVSFGRVHLPLHHPFPPLASQSALLSFLSINLTPGLFLLPPGEYCWVGASFRTDRGGIWGPHIPETGSEGLHVAWC